MYSSLSLYRHIDSFWPLHDDALEVLLEELYIFLTLDGLRYSGVILKASDDGVHDAVFDVVNEYQEKYWPENGALRDSTDDQCKEGKMAINDHSLCSVSEERLYPLDDFRVDTVQVQFLQEEFMIYFVKCFSII